MNIFNKSKNTNLLNEEEDEKISDNDKENENEEKEIKLLNKKTKRSKIKNIMEDKIENKIIDYICYSHRIPKSYSKYCSTCKVDICDWCKGHDGHYIIDYSSMDQNPEDFKRKEKKYFKINGFQ